MSLTRMKCLAELSEPGRCPKCEFDNAGTTSGDEDKYLVLHSLFQRASSDGVLDARGRFYRVEPTAREAALLNHGDQCEVDGVHWRITAKGEGYVYVFGWRPATIPSADGGYDLQVPITVDYDAYVKTYIDDEAEFERELEAEGFDWDDFDFEAEDDS